ncbi:DUF4244 domain-containing protein [Corynebacterium sp. L4756]|uniref:DUF4244 domain-containing protein n=1 Tax=unclassified Corynebacterium TaxID=2624378 RepID=UPI00374DDD27
MNTINLKTQKAIVAIGQKTAALRNDNGMSTVEYAMGSLAAAALAAVLYMVINGGGVIDAIEGIITEALSNSPG